jgi:hypothetical protein
MTRERCTISVANTTALLYTEIPAYNTKSGRRPRALFQESENRCVFFDVALWFTERRFSNAVPPLAATIQTQPFTVMSCVSNVPTGVVVS